MPGLLGYIYNDKNIAKNKKSSLINDMCNSIMHEYWYKTDLLEGGTFSLARVHQNIFSWSIISIFRMLNRNINDE